MYSASSSPLLLRGAPDTARIMSEFHAKDPQATAIEGLAQGPYMTARVGFEPMALRTKGSESTNEPPRNAPLDIRRHTDDSTQHIHYS